MILDPKARLDQKIMKKELSMILNSLLKVFSLISEIIANNKSHNVALAKIVSVLAKNVGVQVCSVYVYDDVKDVLELRATHGLNRDCIGDVFMKPGEGLTGSSFKYRKIINLADARNSSLYKHFKNIGEDQYNSFLSVPLTVGKKCVGVLVFQNKHSMIFEEIVIDTVKSISTQLANLILNERIIRAVSSENYLKRVAEYERQDGGKKKQLALHGLAANIGIAIGKAFILKSTDSFKRIEHENIKDVDREISIFEKAVEITKDETLVLEERALSMITEADASIFYAHLLFLEDENIINAVVSQIKDERHTIEFSLKLVFTEYEKRFASLNDQIFKDKVMDLKDVMLRLLEGVRRIRTGRKNSGTAKPKHENQILIARELLPSDLIRMPLKNIAGIVCEKGGVSAHVAILAKALNIPSLTGVKKVMNRIKPGNKVIIDCHSETVYIHPESKVVDKYREILKTKAKAEKSLVESGPSLTKDNIEINVKSNISLLGELSLVKKYGAKGIGLYRTEFMYMLRDYLPSEEYQYKIFSKVFKEVSEDEVTVRVLDIGGDKPLPYLKLREEDNPSLGQRGIRLLLSKPDIFIPHLKAILRAGRFGKLKILFPMVSCFEELKEIKKTLLTVEEELKEKNKEFSRDYEVGIMLEVPSIVFALDDILEEVDFMSIGSNDLFQYFFAVDRSNVELAGWHSVMNPIFLKILHKIGSVFKRKSDKKLTMCGEMASNPFAAPLLIGAGIFDISMASQSIPSVRSVIKFFTVDECESCLKRAMGFETAKNVIDMMREEFRKREILDRLYV